MKRIATTIERKISVAASEEILTSATQNRLVIQHSIKIDVVIIQLNDPIEEELKIK